MTFAGLRESTLGTQLFPSLRTCIALPALALARHVVGLHPTAFLTRSPLRFGLRLRHGRFAQAPALFCGGEHRGARDGIGDVIVHVFGMMRWLSRPFLSTLR